MTRYFLDPKTHRTLTLHMEIVAHCGKALPERVKRWLYARDHGETGIDFKNEIMADIERMRSALNVVEGIVETGGTQ